MWVPKVVDVGVLPLSIQGKVVPAWCGLPVPGEWSLVVSSEGARPSTTPVDVKRMYVVGAHEDADIQVADLPDTRLKIFHHRNGHVYVAAVGKARVHLTGVGGTTRELTDQAELVTEADVIVVGETTLRVQRHILQSGVKQALGEQQSEDIATRANTVINKKKREDSPLVKTTVTPPRTRKKGRVRFLGFSPPQRVSPKTSS